MQKIQTDKDFKLYPSKLKTKKWTAEFKDGQKVHFGQRGASDYTIHKDKKRRDRYLKRHRANEDWYDLRTAGALSRWILWNEPTLVKSIKHTEQRFGLYIDVFNK